MLPTLNNIKGNPIFGDIMRSSKEPLNEKIDPEPTLVY